jgi:hypothetical protein
MLRPWKELLVDSSSEHPDIQRADDPHRYVHLTVYVWINTYKAVYSIIWCNLFAVCAEDTEVDRLVDTFFLQFATAMYDSELSGTSKIWNFLMMSYNLELMKFTP